MRQAALALGVLLCAAQAGAQVPPAADPGAIQRVDVVPKPTRTYNAALAFDPASNFGQNEARQVDVATPRAVRCAICSNR